MRIAVLGDLHLVAPDEPDHDRRHQRRHFVDTAAAWEILVRSLQHQQPDLMVCVGDVVDWHSPANVAFARRCLDSLGIPWLMTPGNHDLEGGEADSRNLWHDHGLELGNRLIDCDGLGLVMLDSHNSGLPADTGSWLEQHVASTEKPLILLTHVPWDTPAMRDWILIRQPGRDLGKYVQSRAPDIYDRHLRGRFHSAFFGHLHYAGTSREDGTRCHMLSLALHAADRNYPGQGRYAILDSSTLATSIIAEPGPEGAVLCEPSAGSTA